MSLPRSAARRLALRLVSHARRILPDHRAEWARAMAHEVEHLPDDGAALRWAFGAVLASYTERAKMTKSVFQSAALVLAALIVIEGSHVLSQFLLQDAVRDLLLETVPASLLSTDAGSFAPFGVMLVAALSAPLVAVAYLLGKGMTRLAPSRAHAVIITTIAMDAAFLAGIIAINFLLMRSLDPAPTFSPSTLLLWLIRVLFVAAPLVAVLRGHRQRLDAVTSAR